MFLVAFIHHLNRYSTFCNWISSFIRNSASSWVMNFACLLSLCSPCCNRMRNLHFNSPIALLQPCELGWVNFLSGRNLSLQVVLDLILTMQWQPINVSEMPTGKAFCRLLCKLVVVPRSSAALLHFSVRESSGQACKLVWYKQL